MSDLRFEFARLLESERAFARCADVDALSAIQDEKRTVLEALLATDLSENERTTLREQALANVQLIRHLVACLHGLIAPDSPTYTAGGGRPMGAMGRSWGRL